MVGSLGPPVTGQTLLAKAGTALAARAPAIRGTTMTFRSLRIVSSPAFFANFANPAAMLCGPYDGTMTPAQRAGGLSSAD
jgi:hypothetical protein